MTIHTTFLRRLSIKSQSLILLLVVGLSGISMVTLLIYVTGTGTREQTLGVLAPALSVDEVNKVMTGDRQWSSQGLGQTGEAYLVGKDFLLRSDSRFLLQDKTNYLREIAARHVAPTIVARIDRLNTSVLLESVKTAQGLAEADLQELATDSRVRHFARDEFVVREGDLGEIQEARRKATGQAKRGPPDTLQGDGSRE